MYKTLTYKINNFLKLKRLMEEIPNNHLGYIKYINLVNKWDFNYQPQLVNAGFLNHQQFHQCEAPPAHESCIVNTSIF